MNWESRKWAKPLWGRGGGTQLFLKALFAFFFFTYIIVGIHTYIFHNRECDFFKYLFWGGQPSDGGGHVPSVPPGIYAHESSITSWKCGLRGRPRGFRVPFSAGNPQVFPDKCAICIRRLANGPWAWSLRLRLPQNQWRLANRGRWVDAPIRLAREEADFNMFKNKLYIQVHLNKLECRGKVHLFQ